MNPARPNLFVIGASKCGTTFFHNLLSQHHEIHMSAIKEPWYFNRENYLEDLDWYLSLFECGSECRIRGESTPIYSETTEFPDIPRRIHEFSPGSKIVYLVREPFSRFKSIWAQTLSSGHWAQKKYYPIKMPLSYREAVFGYPAFLEACRYWTHIQNYRKYFDKEEIKVIFFERLVSDIEGTLRETFEFLRVDADAVVNSARAHKNLREGKTLYKPWGNRVGQLFPNTIKNLVPKAIRRVLHTAMNKLPAPTVDHADLLPSEAERVKEVLYPEIAGLYKYLNIQGDPWVFFSNRKESHSG